MTLISCEALLRRLESKECIISGVRLGTDEYIASAAAFPQLYASAEWDKQSTSTLRQIIEIFVNEKTLFSGTAGDRSAYVKGFFSNLIKQRDAVPEFCVHAWMYLFWETIAFKNAAIRPAGEVFFTSRSLDAAISPSHRYFKLVKRLKDLTCVDLVAISEDQQHIFLVEIKRGSLDDRAVGQVLRYYNESSKLLYERLARDFNLAYVRPVLVLGVAERQFMDALPTHFRDILDVFQYDVSNDENGFSSVHLAHLRKRFLSAQMA